MKAIAEVGIGKVAKFAIFSILEIVYHATLFPQFRALFLWLLGAKIGHDSVLMKVNFFNWHHTGPKGLTIGNECFIGDYTRIDLYDKVTLGNQVTIAQNVTILTHLNVGYKNHPLQKAFPKKSQPVTFENGCVVGASSTILPGVTIGSNSFVAAGSVVTKNVPANQIVAGVPAKAVKKIEQ